MPPQSSAFPIAMPDEVNLVENFEEDITRISPEPEDEFPEEFRERRRLVRRRANLVQGRSLETLGHAVEYLVDSRMFVVEPSTAKAEREAVQILMRLSRMVFADCDEVVSVWEKMARLLDNRRDVAEEQQGLRRTSPRL